MKKNKSKYYINERKAINAVKAAASSFAWDIDTSFAKLMLPIIDKYIEEGFPTIDFGYINLTKKEKFLIYIFSKLKLNDKIKKIRENRNQIFLKDLQEFRKALNDILIEGTVGWNKEWNIEELLPVKYDFIPDKTTNTSFLTVKKGYEKNDRLNKIKVEYNSKQVIKCYKWRKKQFQWFINNLSYLWW